MKGKVLKKAALGMALGACLASMAPLAMAQARPVRSPAVRARVTR